MKSSRSNISWIGSRLRRSVCLMVSLSCVVMSQAPQANEPRKEAPSTAAIVFGLGSPNINAQRSGTSIGIVAGGTVYLFDAGAGVERRMMEAAPKLAALHVQTLGPLFITHLDMDHILGLAVLPIYNLIDSASTLSLGGALRGGMITVYGPGPAKGRLGIREVMDHVHAAFFPNVTADNSGDGIRIDKPFTDFAARAIEITPGVVYRDSNVTVTAFTVAHKTPIAYGFRVQTSDRVIVISGDTRPVDAVVEACNGCDLLFHEMFGIDFGPSGPQGAAQGHTSAVELGEIARRAHPKHLVIYHDVNYPSQQAATHAIRKAFSGEVTFARDLDIF
jgi:ribonuclease BN (tRNA processing enzyme)